MKKIIFFLLSLGLLFTILYSPSATDTENMDLEVHFIDVGQGDSILIKSNGENMLIDGGGRSTSEKVVSYLENQGVKDLKYVVGTHPHEDHIGGLVSVLDNFNVENIMMPNIISNTKVFEDLLDAIEREKLKIKKPVVLDTLNLGDAELLVLGPNSDKYSITNNYSIVLKLQHGYNSFLFTGDAEKQSEIEMIEAHNSILKSDVLKTGHHGSNTSSNPQFLDAVDPKYSIISVATKNIYDHPSKDILKDLEKRDIIYYRTDIDGDIVIKSNGKNIELHIELMGEEISKGFSDMNIVLKDILERFIRYIKYSFIVKHTIFN